MPDDDQAYLLPDGRFPTGQLMITAHARDEIGLEEAAKALRRHVAGDWGEIDEHDGAANEAALNDGSRLFSVYRTAENAKFYIVTEADRSYTTVLLPEDY